MQNAPAVNATASKMQGAPAANAPLLAKGSRKLLFGHNKRSKKANEKVKDVLEF